MKSRSCLEQCFEVRGVVCAKKVISDDVTVNNVGFRHAKLFTVTSSEKMPFLRELPP